MSKTQCDYLRSVFADRADAVFLIDARDGSSLTYRELLDQSLKLASALSAQGLAARGRIVMSSENCVEVALLYFACMHLGAEIVPINPGAHARDFETTVEQSQPQTIFMSAAVHHRIGGAWDSSAAKVCCFRPGVDPPKKKSAAAINFDFATELARHRPWDGPFSQLSDEDTLLVMMSSGTTGQPKGIELCAAGLVGNGRAMVQRMGMDTDSRFYDILPMTYLGGFYNLLLIPLICGGSVILDAAFGVPNLYAFWDVVREHRVNTLWFTTTMLSMLLSLGDEEDLTFLKSQIRLALCGMAPLPVELKRQFERRFGFVLYENYALSETLFITTNHPSLAYQDGSVGFPLPNVQVEILDEAQRPLSAGAEGQVAVRTPYFMKGYRHAGQADRDNLLPGGRFLTGDIGYFDAAGELFISGRLKDLIIRGGVNISPKSLENVIHGLPAVQQVAVIGIPHSVYGEEVVAVVKLHDEHKSRTTPADIQRYCDEHIANFERPKHVLVIDSMPVGATGKVQKNVLRRLVQEKIDPMGGNTAS